MASSKPTTRQKVSNPKDRRPFIEKVRRLAAMEPTALNEAELSFLHARKSYLTKDEAKKFSKVFKALEKSRK